MYFSVIIELQLLLYTIILVSLTLLQSIFLLLRNFNFNYSLKPKI